MKVKNILRGVIATVMTLIIILNLASCDVAEIVEGLMDNIDDKVENDMIDMDDFEDAVLLMQTILWTDLKQFVRKRALRPGLFAGWPANRRLR